MRWVGIRLASGEPIRSRRRCTANKGRSFTGPAAARRVTSFHHAVLNGLYVLIERDALLLTC
jgi:hypothetical protein